MTSVLYVDDEESLLEVGKRFLEKIGKFNVTTESSVAGAIKLIKQSNFDAIVSDYQMPEYDGIQLLKIVRSEFGDIPFILFTGRGREEVVIDAINNGADFYLQKGGDPTSQFAELTHKIRIAIERRQSVEAVKDSEQRLTDLINFLPDATFAINNTGHVIIWNRAMEEMTGIPAIRMLGKGDHEYAIPFYGTRRKILIDLIFETDETIAKDYDNVVRKNKILTADTLIPDLKGKPVYLMGTASSLYNRQGEIVGSIESIRDITDRRAAETELHAAYEQIAATEEELQGQFDGLVKGEARIRESELRFRSIVEASPHPIAISDTNTGKYLLVNEAFQHMTGYQEDEIIGKDAIELGLMTREDQRRRKELYISQKKIENERFTIISRDGKRSVVLLSFLPIGFDDRIATLTMAVDITKLVQTEAALHRQERILEDTFTSIKDGISILDTTMTVIRVNKTMEEWYSHEMPIVGRKCWEVYHGRKERCEICPSIQTLRNGKLAKERVPLVDAGQAVGSLDLYSFPLIDSVTGEMTGVIEYVRNVTKEIEAQYELEKYRQQLDEITRTLPGLVYQFYARPDGSMGLYYVSNRAEEIFGISHTTNDLFERFVENVDSRDREAFLSSITGAIKTGQPWRFEGRFIKPAGEIIWFSGASQPVRHGEELVYSGILMDITSQKNAQNELLKREELYRKLVTTVPDVIVHTDLAGNIEYINETGYSIAGFSSGEEMTGLPVFQLFSPDELPRVQSNIELMFRQQAGPVEYEFVAKDNHRYTLEINGDVLRNPDGTPFGLVFVGRDVTGRKYFSEQLKNSEELYRLLLQSANDAVYIHEMNPEGPGPFLEVNDKACKMLGYSRDELLRMGPYDIDAPDEHEKIQVIADQLREKGNIHFETVHVTKSKRKIPVEISIRLVDLHGKQMQISIVRDISDRKRADEDLRRSEERYRHVVEDQTEFISRFLPDGTHVFVNEAYCRYFNLNRKKILGHRFRPDIPPADRVSVKNFFDSLTREHPVDSIEHRIIMPDGTVRWQRWSDRAIFDDKGNIIEFQSVGRDITQSKNTEFALEQLNRSVTQNEARLKTLLRFYQISDSPLREILTFAIEEGVKMTDSKVGYLAFVSEDETILTMYAWSEDAMKECGIHKKPIRYPVNTTGLWGEAIRQRKPVVTNDYSAPNPLKKGYPKGHVPIIRHMNVPIFDKNHIVLVAGVGNKETDYDDTDVNELSLLMNGLWNMLRRRRAEKALFKSNQHLQLMNDITRHDIANQLTVLRGYIDLSADSQNRAGTLNDVIEKEKSIVELIAGHLSFMKDYQNIGLKEPDWQDLSAIVAKQMVPEDVSINFEPDGVVTIYADLMFEKVLANLIDNSLRHGKNVSKINITLKERDKQLFIVYEDNGVGISKKDKKHLFERGFGKHTGLGLFLVREILAITGITIQETGEPGKGARFEIIVPGGRFRCMANQQG